MDVRVEKTETAAMIDVEKTCVIMRDGKYLSCQYTQPQTTGPQGQVPAKPGQERRYLFWGDDISVAVKGANPGKVRYCARHIAAQEGIAADKLADMMEGSTVYKAIVSVHAAAPQIDAGTVTVDRVQQIEAGIYVGFSRSARMVTSPIQAMAMPPGMSPQHARYRAVRLKIA